MEDQAQKMEALKKAYAEIILNTAKEAAARTMASERKALRFHHDLRNTKDEALRLLLRFKQTMDFKTTEAETRNLHQQKRIAELDAQLNETEGVIMNLRAELTKAQERLEEMRNHLMIHSNEPSETKQMDHEITAHDNKLDVTEQSSPNLASMIIGHKEPESYRNGYTHRIRAIERNLVDEKDISEDKSKKEINININGSEAISTNNSVVNNQTVKTRFSRKRSRYTKPNCKLSRFCHPPLNHKEKSYGKDEKSTENNEIIENNLRRSIRKRKVRCWDEISSSFKSRAAISRCKKYLSNNGVKFDSKEETELVNESVVEKHEVVEKESVSCNETDSVVTGNSDKNRLLKYTFSRKRKRVLSSKSDNEKVNMIEDSSSDSQNMVEVACQLISLAGERSW